MNQTQQIKAARERAEAIRKARADHSLNHAPYGWQVVNGQLRVWIRPALKGGK